MFKFILPALAAIGLAAVPAQAKAQDVRGSVQVTIGDPNYTPYRYMPYGYEQRTYHGRIYIDRRGFYRCVKWNGRLGYLTTRYGERLNRWNAYRLYYGTRGYNIRCS